MNLLHIISVIGTGMAVFYADEQAFMWIVGKKQRLSARMVRVMHVIVGLGLAALILTGGLLFVDRSAYLLKNPTFLVKMIFVTALIINTFFVERLSHVATVHAFKDLTHQQRFPLFISGAVSLLSWIGAGICGLLISGIL
jgi:hypothetical protein